MKEVPKASLGELLKRAEGYARKARRNVGDAWRLIEDAKLKLAESK